MNDNGDSKSIFDSLILSFLPFIEIKFSVSCALKVQNDGASNDPQKVRRVTPMIKNFDNTCFFGLPDFCIKSTMIILHMLYHYILVYICANTRIPNKNPSQLDRKLSSKCIEKHNRQTPYLSPFMFTLCAQF